MMMSIFFSESKRGSGSEIGHCTVSTTCNYYRSTSPIQQRLYKEESSVCSWYTTRREQCQQWIKSREESIYPMGGRIHGYNPRVD